MLGVLLYASLAANLMPLTRLEDYFSHSLGKLQLPIYRFEEGDREYSIGRMNRNGHAILNNSD